MNTVDKYNEHQVKIFTWRFGRTNFSLLGFSEEQTHQELLAMSEYILDEFGIDVMREIPAEFIVTTRDDVLVTSTEYRR